MFKTSYTASSVLSQNFNKFIQSPSEVVAAKETSFPLKVELIGIERHGFSFRTS